MGIKSLMPFWEDFFFFFFFLKLIVAIAQGALQALYLKYRVYFYPSTNARFSNALTSVQMLCATGQKLHENQVTFVYICA